MNRRKFLSNCVSASLGGGFLITQNLFAQNKISANEKINVGIIGLGKMANGHKTGIAQNPLCRIVGICDVDDARLAYTKKYIEGVYAKQSGGNVSDTVKTYKDFRLLLADKSIDAVFIVTPDHWHAIISIMAARAGKAIYCEKPMTFTVEESKAVVRAVKESGVVFQTGSQQRSDNAFRWLAQLAQDGTIGDIKEVYCNFGRRYPMLHNWQAEPLPKGIDWDMWIGPAPFRPYTSLMLPELGKDSNAYDFNWPSWRWHAEYGNGLQADWGAHHLDIALWALGLDGKGAKYVEVYEEQNKEVPADKNIIGYTFENGVKLRYGVPEIVEKNSGGISMVSIVGSEGVISASRGDRRWASNPNLLNVKLKDSAKTVYASLSHKSNFYEAILTGRPTICPAEVGASSCNMCLIGNIAHSLGRSLEWDWRTQKFVGDAAANTFLSRKNRGEWANILG